MEHLPEWEKARILNHYLVQSKKILATDVVIADGFWADGLQHLDRVVSHSHGIWSHLTKEDVDAGRQPDMPYHHATQVNFRRRWTEMGKHITAVSDFIANEMDRQWGFKVDRVINNGVDVDRWVPRTYYLDRKRPLIIHGINDRGNLNKGWDHIELLKTEIDADVLSLDEAAEFVSGTKTFAMQQADLVVHPSGYEGNSMFVAEAMASGVPVIGYDVGFLWSIKGSFGTCVMDRTKRPPEETLENVRYELEAPDLLPMMGEIHRHIAVEKLSSAQFARAWGDYIKEIEG